MHDYPEGAKQGDEEVETEDEQTSTTAASLSSLSSCTTEKHIGPNSNWSPSLHADSTNKNFWLGMTRKFETSCLPKCRKKAKVQSGKDEDEQKKRAKGSQALLRPRGFQVADEGKRIFVPGEPGFEPESEPSASNDLEEKETPSDTMLYFHYLRSYPDLEDIGVIPETMGACRDPNVFFATAAEAAGSIGDDAKILSLRVSWASAPRVLVVPWQSQ